MEVATGATRCGTHPEALAIDTCSRCGAFVCERCLVLIGEEAFCASCYARRDVSGPASLRAAMALLCAGFGLFFVPPLSLLALLLVWLERRAIARGDAPRTSVAEIRAAKVVAWVGLVLQLLGVGAIAAWSWLLANLDL
ncbi:MAG: hypothetical protein IRZ16_02100 [Myxococcaceae bacterium]|nr:hypothetical protein [Myxococcaceae bacterium]